MSTQPGQEEQASVITLEGDDGHSYSCQILDIFNFEQKEYALLLNLGETNSEGGENENQGSIVVMRLTERGDQSIFQTIESEEEFERVIAHVEEMVKKAEESASE
jgi:uncharacterized protein YrzB (UPF0473 family)